MERLMVVILTALVALMEVVDLVIQLTAEKLVATVVLIRVVVLII